MLVDCKKEKVKTDGKRNVWQKTRKWIGVILLIGGMAVFFYPDLGQIYQKQTTIQQMTEFRKHEKYRKETDKELCSKMQIYNQKLYENGQSELYQADSMQRSTIWKEFQQYEPFGYIEIPKMDCVLPLFLGASVEHLDQGASVLEGTSVPVGGRNTNCVIAGHRGWRQKAYFKQIEMLQVGDMVYITNPWERLSYCVEKIEIIEPDDFERIRILEGQEMITLMTCHPYRSGGKYRYLVLCSRVSAEDEKTSESVRKNKNRSNISENTDQEIVQEKKIRQAGMILLCGFLLCTFCKKRKERRGLRYDEKKSHR